VITDHLMLDVLRSTTTVYGELSVMTTLATLTLKSPVLCLDLGEFLFHFILSIYMYTESQKLHHFILAITLSHQTNFC